MLKSQPDRRQRRNPKSLSKRSRRPLAGRFEGLGVDLVDLKRIRDMLRRHGSCTLGRLLSAGEKRRFGKKRVSALDIAKKFAAKEAYFKALGGNWTGDDFFSKVDVHEGPRGKFRVETEGAATPDGRFADGSFFYDGRWVSAQVMVWSVKDPERRRGVCAGC